MTTNCARVEDSISQVRTAQLFKNSREYGVRHGSASRNVIIMPDLDASVSSFEYAILEKREACSQRIAIMIENANQDSSSNLSLSWNGRTDVGRFRKNNEDAFLALTFDDREVHYLGKDGSALIDGADFIFAVSDGMGGAKAGEFASKIAVDKITDLMPKTFSLATMGIDRGCAQILGELFSRIHSEMIWGFTTRNAAEWERP